jgi:hypothetical protein
MCAAVAAIVRLTATDEEEALPQHEAAWKRRRWRVAQVFQGEIGWKVIALEE